MEPPVGDPAVYAAAVRAAMLSAGGIRDLDCCAADKWAFHRCIMEGSMKWEWYEWDDWDAEELRDLRDMRDSGRKWGGRTADAVHNITSTV